MKRPLILSLLALALALPALAQNDGPYIYATYFECNPTGLAALDAAHTSDIAPALNAHVAAGDITAWGAIAHHSGGRWNRANYQVAPTIDALMAFHDEWQIELRRDHASTVNALQATCPTHEDYIWRFLASSQAPTETARNRPTAGISTYFMCNQSRLDRADDLVREAFGPVLNGLVSEGLLTSWMWQAHVIGGPYTRLLVMDGPTHIANLHAVEQLVARMQAQQARASTEFNEICSGHQDYLWDVQSSN